MIGGAFRRKEMARAYAKHYGDPKIEDLKIQRHLLKVYRKEIA